jgi:hypothetical protein
MGRCSFCRIYGHNIRTCPNRNKPLSQMDQENESNQEGHRKETTKEKKQREENQEMGRWERVEEFYEHDFSMDSFFEYDLLDPILHSWILNL